MLSRYYQETIEQDLHPGKVLVIYGPRQVGKTTLIETYLKHTKLRYRLETGDDIQLRQILESESVSTLKNYAEGYDLIVIDEAQRVSNIGLALKILVDQNKTLRVIATGSASFDLSNKLGEPLTGRKVTRILYPLSQLELNQSRSGFDLNRNLETFLIYGAYPEVLNTPSSKGKEEYLRELVGSYLLKDILEMEKIRSPRLLLDLLRCLAFQVGNDVSMSELATQLRIDVKTVGRYLDLLEKSFVIISLSAFSRNLRKEISKSRRYVFYDNGVRNAILANFNALRVRNDVGALWENFMITERIKRNTYLQKHANLYFWRTYDQQEIDLIEETQGQLNAFEFKWSPKRVKTPKIFLETYPTSTFTVITQDNHLPFTTS